MASLIPRCFSFINTSMRLHHPVRTLVAFTRLTPAAVHHVSHRRNVGYRIGGCIVEPPQPYYSIVRSLRISSNYGAGENPPPPESGKDKKDPETTQSSDETPVKPTLFQRFKQMYKDYWYVLIPVHCVTSAGWATIFYFSVKNGFDVVGLLENLNVSEKIIQPLRSSSVGYYALTYAMYKAATPVRYAVTVGGTTVSINYLTRWGLIKPVPSKAQMQLMYQNRKERFNTQREELRRKLRQHRAELKRKVSFKPNKRNKKMN